MTDDIVTELRDWAAITDAPKGKVAVVMLSGQVFTDAADEIERLRAELNKWMGISERFAESHPHYDAFRYYFKAVRGD